MRTRSKILIASMMLALLAMPAFGATSATSTNTISPTLKINVTVQSAIQLTLATNSQCAVTPAGGAPDYSMNFGNVDALGINAPTCGSQFLPTTPGTTNAAYFSDYKITPIFTSQSVATNTLKAYVSANFAKANLSVVYNVGPGVPASIAALSAMGVTAGTANTLGTNLTSGTAVVQYIGVEVAPTNGAGLTGADAATVTYTLTVM